MKKYLVFILLVFNVNVYAHQGHNGGNNNNYNCDNNYPFFDTKKEYAKQLKLEKQNNPTERDDIARENAANKVEIAHEEFIQLQDYCLNGGN